MVQQLLTQHLLLLSVQDPDLREAAALLQKALNAETVQEEEQLWTQVGQISAQHQRYIVY